MHNVNVKQHAEATNGGTVYSDTSSHTGNWFRVTALADATFTSLTGNVTGLSSTVLKAGHSLHGTFTALELASGAVVVYNSY